MLQSSSLRIIAASLALALGAGVLASPIRQSFREIAALDDSVARADLQLSRELTPARASRELAQALDAHDEDLAASLIELADERSVAVPVELRGRFDELRADRSPLRIARDFKAGFVDGETGSGGAMSGALVADLSGFGDLRELTREGAKWMSGAEPDALIVGLSAAGLAVSAVTWTSLGAALPARGGLSIVKALQKTGRLSKPLAVELSRVAHGALDSGALKASAAAVARFDLAAAREATGSVIRPKALAGFRQLGSDVSVVYQRAGARGAQDVLATAGTRAEVRTAAEIAAAKGSKTRAVLKVLGRGVLLAGSLSLTILGWLFAAVGYLFAAASLARRFGEFVGRRLWSLVDLLRSARASTRLTHSASTRAILSAPVGEG